MNPDPNQPAEQPINPNPAPIVPPAPAPAPIPAPELETTPPEPTVFQPTIVQPTVVQPTELSEPVEPVVVTPIVPAPAVLNPAPAPTVSTGDNSTTAQAIPPVEPPKKSGNTKKLALLIGVPVLVVLLLSGFVFGYYLPHTPANMWNTGVERSGTAVSKLLDSATDKKKLDSLTTSEVTGTVDIDINGAKVAGDLNATFDKSSVDAGANVTFKSGDVNQKISARILAETSAKATYPDVYAQITGLKNTALSLQYPEINDVDGKWISVSSSYLESLVDMSGVKADKAPQLSSSDVVEVTKAVSDVTKDYVFNTDSEKNVLVRDSFVGKEKVDGVKVYHYKASINEAHTKAYCVALTNKLYDTNAYKKLSGDTAAATSNKKKDTAKGCNSESSSKDKNDTFDVYIGGKYNLIRKIRVSDPDNKKSYIDLGQNYKGGDDVTFSVNYHDDDTKANVTSNLKINTKTNATDFDLNYKGNEGTVALSLSAKGTNNKVKITKPTDSVPLETLLAQLQLMGGGSAASSSSFDTSSDLFTDDLLTN